jgi:hypothetical protein
MSRPARAQSETLSQKYPKPNKQQQNKQTKISEAKRAAGEAQVAECLSSKREALGSSCHQGYDALGP